MALYLGNQKVSLRSGQDPTFDYGFDSNGRLVFANKNATEINNFLNYDSTYSEILDLSNLSKMEKVAVNGTVDRKMEGLKGLLVSPNAPFTGSSPQINASYTGLNKSALVSLFESVPYNVGYEKVGNPTIVDGVVTFPATGANFLRLPRINFDTVDFEFVFKATPGKWPHAGGSVLYSFGSGPSAYILFINSRLAYYAARGYTTPNLDFEQQSFVTGQYYYIKFKKKNEVMSLGWSNDNLSYTEQNYQIQNGDDFHLNSNIQIGHNGYHQSEDFYGSIDLNETYIKVNGVPWFGPGVTKNLVPSGTVVGDVTVKDGIASGLSNSNHLKINGVPNSITYFEFGTKVNTGDLFAYCTIFGNNSTNRHCPQIEYNSSDNSMYFTTPLSDFTWGQSIKYVVSSNTNYWFKYIFENNKCSAYVSSDGISYTLINQVSQPSIGWDEWIQIGADQSKDYWKGSIDLNNTYIKVGSNYFYRGMVPMTKTCSIVGATGTADLTQEDKNIILNKGWSLTVQ